MNSIHNATTYTPKNIGSIEAICTERCPFPRKPCKGECAFFKRESKKIRQNGQAIKFVIAGKKKSK